MRPRCWDFTYDFAPSYAALGPRVAFPDGDSHYRLVALVLKAEN